MTWTLAASAVPLRTLHPQSPDILWGLEFWDPERLPSGTPWFEPRATIIMTADDIFGVRREQSLTRPTALVSTGLLPGRSGPPLGAHVRLPSGLTIGLAVAVGNGGGAESASSRALQAVTFLFQAGFIHPFNEQVGLWVRSGPSLHLVHGDGESRFMGVDAQVDVVISLAPHMALSFGPALDVSLLAENGRRPSSQSFRTGVLLAL